MTKYIDLQEFLNQYKGNIWTAKIDYAQGIRDVVDDLKKFPSADVAPVIHAHRFKDYGVCEFDFSRYETYRCSNCKGEVDDDVDYCSHCGAKFDEEEDE